MKWQPEIQTPSAVLLPLGHSEPAVPHLGAEPGALQPPTGRLQPDPMTLILSPSLDPHQVPSEVLLTTTGSEGRGGTQQDLLEPSQPSLFAASPQMSPSLFGGTVSPLCPKQIFSLGGLVARGTSPS